MPELESIEIRPCGAVRGAIRPPGSKSLTNRALVCAALAEGASTLTGVLESEDTHVMVDALRALGINVTGDIAAGELKVLGCAGRIPAHDAELYVSNSGTTMRFLTALVALGQGTYRLDGNARMRERPIGDLIAALAELGVTATCESPNQCPPVRVAARGLRGGRALLRGDVSSQFLSGLLLAAPYARAPVELTMSTPLVSVPYVAMTIAVMNAFGGSIESDQDFSHFNVAHDRQYQARSYAIEPDASAASYFFGVAAITGGSVTVQGLSRASLQGDVALVDVLERMGCSVEADADSITVSGRAARGVDVDMNAISDTVQTLAVVALFAEEPTTIRNVGHIRHKETNRIGDLATELRKLGATVAESADGLRIEPAAMHGATLDTYDDHRMAMSLALAGLRVSGVVIRDPGCTRKTYPRYFNDLEELCRAARA